MNDSHLPCVADPVPDRAVVSRREALATLACTVGVGVAAGLFGLTVGDAAAAVRLHALTGVTPEDLGWDAARGEYVLPELPYAYDAIEPAIDAETMRLHHSIHHAGYVRGLNTAIAALAAVRAGDGAVERVQALSRDLAFHGSGHLLHVLFWKMLRPTAREAGREMSPELTARLEGDFGSIAGFRDEFIGAAMAAEGSGWAILAHEPVADRLVILSAEKHQDLTIHGVRPILACDVWEHAYYLKYRARRGDYVRAFLAVTDWGRVEGMLNAEC